MCLREIDCEGRFNMWSPGEEVERCCTTGGGMETLIHFVWYGGRSKGEEGAETEGEMRDVGRSRGKLVATGSPQTVYSR